MLSESRIDKDSASHHHLAPSIEGNISRKFPVQGQHEITLNKWIVNQQLILKRKANKWRWLQKDTRPASNLSFKLLTNTMKSDKKMQKFEL